MIRIAVCDDEKAAVTLITDELKCDLSEYGMAYEIETFLSSRDLCAKFISEGRTMRKSVRICRDTA